MSTPTPNQPGQALPPAVTVHARGVALGLIDSRTAQLVLHNPVVHAVANVTRAELRALVVQLDGIADRMEDTPEASALVLPDGAGQLTVAQR